MKINFLGQGFEEMSADSVGNQLVKFFADKSFHTFTGITAFTSLSAIQGLSNHIKTAKEYITNITIVTGIDQKGTSKEALEELLALDINAFVFYQTNIAIFHPKIYLFEGNDTCELIIGSSNLTSQGLFANVEASLHVSIDNSFDSERKIVEQLKKYFKGIFDHSDPNLKKLNEKLIADLVKANVVPTEDERKAAQDKERKADIKEIENIITKLFPKRAITNIPSEFRGIRKSKTKTAAVDSAGSSKDNDALALVWKSGKLTERDLNIPTGSNTNRTGSMLFKKGNMDDIDQRHYFRDTVFYSLKWMRDTNPRSAHLERAVATFEIIIEGKNEGTFSLSLTHNSRTDTITYKQKNSMTQISWGDARKVIANANLIGRSVSLFKTKEPDQFILKID